MAASRVARRRDLRVVAAVFLALFALVIGGSPAAAHTGFESSTPADGEVVGEPVAEITVRFTGPAEPTGDGFLALDPDGAVREPVVTAVDDRTFVLTFDPPLTGGIVGVRWNVVAPDAHPIEGSFSFTVDAPAPTITTTTVAPVAVADDAGEPDAAESAGDDAQPAIGSTTTPPGAVLDDDASAGGDADGAVVLPGQVDSLPDDLSRSAADDMARVPVTTLDDFLAVDSSTPGEGTARIGRIIGFPGLALALGGLAFAATTFRGTRLEARRVIGAVRIAALVLVIGSIIEYVGVARIADDSIAGAWSSEPGLAPALRVVGGVAIALGVAATFRRVGSRSLSAAVIDGDVTTRAPADGDELVAGSARVRWVPDARSTAAAVGAAVVVASFWFDGHTVSKGPRLLHAVSNSIHVVAGSVWVGGVVALAAVAWWRLRAGRPPFLAELVVRFSRVATVALAAVGIAGLAMAVFVLDSFGDLTSTQWGQTLLLKTGAVAIATAIGAYHHLRLVPRLDADPDDPALAAELRSTLTAEAIILAFVVIVTAWLVVAAS